MSFRIFILVLTFLWGQGEAEIDLDYYFGGSSGKSRLLRNDDKLECNKLGQLYCRSKCGTKPGMCLKGACYCVYYPTPQDVSPDYSLADAGPDEQYIDEGSLYAYRPTLRHHIAHYCPNLDIARQCIRACMKLGKPAYCGKDHVCYCGHRYNKYPSPADQQDAKAMYAGFQDLYAKYFGANTKITDDDVRDEQTNMTSVEVRGD